MHFYPTTNKKTGPSILGPVNIYAAEKPLLRLRPVRRWSDLCQFILHILQFGVAVVQSI